MPVEFDITLTAKDMYRFNLYQAYSGFQGWFSLAVSLAIFVVAGLTYGEVETMYTILYLAFGVIFLFYLPVSLYFGSRRRLAMTETLKKPLHYSVGEEGIAVSQEGENAVLPWEQIYKMAAIKDQVFVYSNRTNAYVIPREQLGERYLSLKELAEKKLPAYRVRMK